MIQRYKEYLVGLELSGNTCSAYLFALKQYIQLWGKEITKAKLKQHKVWLIENAKPNTVNLRIRGINCYLECIGREKDKLSMVKIQQKNFLENVISEEDYIFFKTKLQEDGLTDWYFVVRFLASTGVRVSELLQFKAEHVRSGYMDLCSKGGKLRRIYVPSLLQEEALLWLHEKGISSGYIFLNQKGRRLTARGISKRMKELGKRYGLNTSVIYPHSFRHRFAKSFLARCNDIAFLADLLGHESIETTRIYLRKTATEQRHLVDMVIDW